MWDFGVIWGHQGHTAKGLGATFLFLLYFDIIHDVDPAVDAQQ